MKTKLIKAAYIALALVLFSAILLYIISPNFINIAFGASVFVGVVSLSLAFTFINKNSKEK